MPDVRPLKNIVVFLNGDRGVDVATSIIANGKDVRAIVAPETSSFWQGKHETEAFRSCKFFKDDAVNTLECHEFLHSLDSDLFIVAGFSTIFKKKILEIPAKGVINLHGGPLPKYRGGSPLNWQMINDEPEITVSVIQMDEGIDTGDVLGEARFSYKDEDTIHDVHIKANKHFIVVTNQVLDELEAGTSTPRIQDESQASYWMQRNPRDGQINWQTMTARQVFNLIRSLAPPYPGAFCFDGEQKITLQSASIPEMQIKGTPGRVVYIQGKGPYIACKDKALLVQADRSLKNGMLLS